MIEICCFVGEHGEVCDELAYADVSASCVDHGPDWSIDPMPLCEEHLLEAMELLHDDDDHDVKWLLAPLPLDSEGPATS